MKSFKDCEAREWSIAITVDVIKRVRRMCEVDLLDLIEGRLIEKFILDPILLCDVLYAVCQPQADERNLSDEDFGRSMAGDAIEHATRALLEDIADFYPSPRERAEIKKVIALAWEAVDMAHDKIEAKLDSGEIQKAIREALANAGDSSGSTPELSESTPAH